MGEETAHPSTDGTAVGQSHHARPQSGNRDTHILVFLGFSPLKAKLVLSETQSTGSAPHIQDGSPPFKSPSLKSSHRHNQGCVSQVTPSQALLTPRGSITMLSML